MKKVSSLSHKIAEKVSSLSHKNILRMLIVVKLAFTGAILTEILIDDERLIDKIFWVIFGTGLTYTMLEQSKEEK